MCFHTRYLAHPNGCYHPTQTCRVQAHWRPQTYDTRYLGSLLTGCEKRYPRGQDKDADDTTTQQRKQVVQQYEIKHQR